MQHYAFNGKPLFPVGGTRIARHALDMNMLDWLHRQSVPGHPGNVFANGLQHSAQRPQLIGQPINGLNKLFRFLNGFGRR